MGEIGTPELLLSGKNSEHTASLSPQQISDLGNADVVFCLATILLSTSALAAPKVIASVMPVHSIVASVMGDVGTPVLLLSGKNSEHTASLSPEKISELGKADVVFMIGGGLEHKLGQVSGTEAVNGKKFFALTGAPGIKTLKIRQGGAFEADDDEELPATTDDQYEFAKKYNVHIWLDPENAKAMTKAIAAELGKIDPEHARTYEANAEAYLASLDQLEKDISAETKSIQGKPFIVFHDAYPYFEKRFGLEALGQHFRCQCGLSFRQAPERNQGQDCGNQRRVRFSRTAVRCKIRAHCNGRHECQSRRS